MSLQGALRKTDGRWHRNPVLEGFGELDRVENQLGAALPADYKWFLQFFANGAEAEFGEVHLQVLPIEQVGSAYELSAEMKQYLVFAVDGDDAYAFDSTKSRASADYPVVQFSLASRDPSEVETIARNLADLLQTLATA